MNVSSSLGSLRLASDPTSRIADWNALFGYSASKTALNAFTVRLAHELRSKNIKVNSACPGYVSDRPQPATRACVRSSRAPRSS